MAEHIKPYSQKENKKNQVSKMFDNIAPYYDFLNRFLSLGIDTIWRKKAIDELLDLDPKKILDVATGTGDVAIEMTKRLNPSQIIGLDISKEMRFFPVRISPFLKCLKKYFLTISLYFLSIKSI